MPPLDINLQELIDQIDTDLAGGDELAKVTEARQRASLLAGVGDQLIDHFVTQARAAGASWSQIGGALGVSKQAAQQRWTPSAFARFTDRARQAVVLSQEKARELGHSMIQPEHVLLGLLAVGHGVAAEVMVHIAGPREELERRITASLPPGGGQSPAHIPFDPECKEAMKKALDVALELGHNYIGTEHLLLGLARAAQGRTARLLADLDLRYEDIRGRIEEWLATFLATRPDPGDEEPPGGLAAGLART